MARCKDCVHYEACSAFSKIINSAREVEKGCEYFKDRTKYVEVVRCRDCRYFRVDPDDFLGLCMCGSIATSYAGEIYPEREHFCSCGERRTDGK